MVRWPAATEAAAYARVAPQLGVGLHLDFAEWAIRDDEWTRLYEVCDLDNPLAVRREVERQIEPFFHLMDRPPTHLDSHQHVHQDVRVRRIVEEAARRLEVPLRARRRRRPLLRGLLRAGRTRPAVPRGHLGGEPGARDPRDRRGRDGSRVSSRVTTTA